jgi:hypothetical protein
LELGGSRRGGVFSGERTAILMYENKSIVL